MWDLSAISMFSVVGRNQKVIFTPRTKFRNVLGDRRTEETIFFILEECGGNPFSIWLAHLVAP